MSFSDMRKPFPPGWENYPEASEQLNQPSMYSGNPPPNWEQLRRPSPPLHPPYPVRNLSLQPPSRNTFWQSPYSPNNFNDICRNIIDNIRSYLQPSVKYEESLIKVFYDFSSLNITYPYINDKVDFVKTTLCGFAKNYDWRDIELSFDLVYVPMGSDDFQQFPTVDSLTRKPNSVFLKGITLIADHAPKPSEEKDTSDNVMRKVGILVKEGRTIYINIEEKDLSATVRLLTTLQASKVIKRFFDGGQTQSEDVQK
jgi:hypothetical protein